MLTTSKNKNSTLPTVMRRMRESSGLTMRQVAAMLGISHVAISQFENHKLDLPDYRIEQLVVSYGCTMEDFNKIIGKPIMTSPLDDCHAMIDKMDEDQLNAVRAILNQIVKPKIVLNVANQSNAAIQTKNKRTFNLGNTKV